MAAIIEITDWALPELEVFAHLTEAQLRNRLEPEKGLFIAESPKVITCALDAGYEPVSFLMEKKHIHGQASGIIGRCGDVPVFTAASDLLAELTGYRLTRGILCAMRRPPLPCVEDLCAGARRVAILENIVDATNIGAIFRSAAALHMDAVLVTPSCCDPLNRRAVRVSMGTVFQVPWTRIGNDPSAWPQPGIARLHRLGFQVAAMALNDKAISRRPAAFGSGKAGYRTGYGGRRTGAPHNSRLRLHRVHPHVPRRRFFKCGGCQRRRFLAA